MSRAANGRKAEGGEILVIMDTLRQILSENVRWRRQIWDLAKIDLVKTYRGAALGKIWLFTKPAVYIFVYWFTLSVGLRHGSDVNGRPFLLWLATGVFPWFFMSDAINTGSNVYRRYPYLVNRIKFPLSVISTFYTLSILIVFAATMGITIAVCLVCGVQLGWQLLQLPLVMALMFLFWTAWSVALSPLSAISKDFANLVKTLTTPFFWLSGILFQLTSLPEAGQIAMRFNPVAWCVEAVRSCFVYDTWIWESPEELLPFLLVFALVVLLALRNYRRLSREVPDVL